MALTHEKKFSYGILAAVGCLLIMVAVGCWAVFSYRAASRLVEHATEVTRRIDAAQMSLKDLQLAGRTFLIVGNTSFPKTFAESFAQIAGQVAELRNLTGDNAEQEHRLDAIDALLVTARDLTRSRVESRQAGGIETADAIMKLSQTSNPTETVHGLLNEMRTTEYALLGARQARADRSGLIGIVVLVTGFVFCGYSVLLLQRMTRQREANLRALEQRSQQISDLYNNAPCGYHSVDEAGIFQSINDTELRWLGYEREELIGTTRHADLLTPDSRKRYERLFEQFKIDGVVRDVEFNMVRKDGSWLPVLLNSTVVRDPDGKFLGTRTTLYDYSERKRTEEIVERARNHAESIVETVREPLLTLDAGLVVRGANRAFYAMFQTTPAETIGQRLAALGHGAWQRPDLLDPLSRIQVDYSTVEDFELAAEFPKIGRRVLLVNARKLYRPGNNTEFVLLALQDITGRKQVENMQQEFRALFESLPGACLVLTPDFNITAVTDAYLEATMTRREQILGRGLFEVFPDNPEEVAATGTTNLRASLQRVLTSSRPDTMAIQRYDVRRPDGTFELRYWSPINSPVFGGEGSIQYIIHRVEDVTPYMTRTEHPPMAQEELQMRLERMEAEVYSSVQAVEIANQKLRQANEELESFSYSVSHDLRAPLRHISGFAQMLEQYLGGKLDEKAQHYLRTIGSSSRQMGVLIDSLLAFSRIGRSEMKIQRVPLGAVVKSVLDSLASEIGERRIAWEVAPLPEVEGDAMLLRQVFANLLGNAVKYTARTEAPRIEIGMVPGESGLATVFVKDNGAGFDPKYAHKLFGVFQRLHTAKEFEGNGVGLATVRRIVQRHGGRVWAEGQPGVGARFSVALRLPANDSPAPSPPSIS